MNLSGEISAVMVFTFWGTAEMGDLVRSALISIPAHQYESGYGLGMTKLQIYRYIIIPQTIRRLLPSLINLLTRMIKTTSLIVLIRYSNPTAALWVYGTIFVMYFLICYPFSKISSYLEKKIKD